MLIKLGQLGKLGGGIHPGFKKLMQVFGSSPVFNSTTGYWEFQDATGNGNHVKITKTSCFLFTSTTIISTTSAFLSGQSELDFNCKLKILAYPGASAFVCYNGAHSDAAKGFRVQVTTLGKVSLTIGDGISRQTITSINSIQLNTDTELSVKWNGLTGGYVYIIINGVTETFTATKSWVGSAAQNITVGSYTSTLICYIFEIIVKNVMSIYFNSSKNDMVFNDVNNTLCNVNNATSTSVSSKFINQIYLTGCTLYYLTTTPTVFLTITGNVNQIIANYTRVAYFSGGLMKQISESYLFPDNSKISTIQELIDAGLYTNGIPNEITGNDIFSIITENPGQVWITKDDNNMTELLVWNKKK